jgi:nicotinamide mononucleotide transporter
LEPTSILSSLFEQLRQQTPLDWSITLTAILYVVLAARENKWCWPWGILSSLLWAYADFFRYNLWADGVLQLFYAGMGFWGIYAWTGGERQGAENHSQIQSWLMKQHLPILIAGGLLGLLLGYGFKHFTPTALPYADSFITAFSIFATVLTIRKVLECWLYWIVLDAAAVFLFLSRDALLVALVMLIYTGISVSGYISWRRKAQSRGD